MKINQTVLKQYWFLNLRAILIQETFELEDPDSFLKGFFTFCFNCSEQRLKIIIWQEKGSCFCLHPGNKRIENILVLQICNF